MTPDEIINLRNIELSAQSNIRSLWQDTSNYVYPYVQITSKFESGTRRTRHIYDVTPMQVSEEMVANLKHILFPAGQVFFAIKVGNREKQELDVVKRYLNKATETTHDALFDLHIYWAPV